MKNHTIFVTTGSGLTADSGIPTLRGTAGLWKHYPAFKQDKITFDDFVKTEFFHNYPKKFWYVYG
jgi:NAD-dependent SIR2 family protein deacetylase